MKKTEKQHNAPPCPASRAVPTANIAKYFHAIGLPCKGCSSTQHGLMQLKKSERQAQALAAAKPPHSRQEAKKATALALAKHRVGKPAQAPLVKKERHVCLSALDLFRDKLPAKHSTERIEFAKRMYETRVQTLRMNSAHVQLADKRGSAKECWMPKSKGM